MQRKAIKPEKGQEKTEASDFVDKLTHVEESLPRQAVLAVLWAAGLMLALGPYVAVGWFCIIMLAIGLPQLLNARTTVETKPYGRTSQILGLLAASIWGFAPFMVWQVGAGKYDHLAVTMIGIGFLQVISRYRSEPVPAFIVAVPYTLLIGWFLYQSRMSTTIIIALIITLAYLMTVFGFVWAGQKSKKAIVEYKLTQDNLRKELEQTRDNALKANQAKSTFLANMSHELRTPLNGIMGLSDILIHEELEGSQKHKMRLIHESGHTLLALLNDILDISKIEANRIEPENLEVSIDEVLHKTFAFWHPVARKKGVALSFQKQKGLPRNILSDPTRIRQCLNNLINNALKFTPKGGQISVTTTGRVEGVGSDYLLDFAIKDTGIGISAANLNRLFTPFVQAEQSTTREFGGTGLGLVISRKLCQLMGGDIKVQSIEGQGSVFLMSIKTKVLQPQELAPLVPEVNPETSGEFRGLRCLIVEDEATNLEVLLLMIEMYGMDVYIARDGQQALDTLKAQGFDVVLMDVQMPVLDGLKTTKQIRDGSEVYKNVPIIAMTANAMEGDQEKCLAAGMDKYLSKPLNRGDLAAAIREVVDIPQKFATQKASSRGLEQPRLQSQTAA